MKKILINAISIKEGGGVVVLTKLLETMSSLQVKIQWIVVVDASMRSKINITKNVKLLCFPWVKLSPLHLAYWYEFYLPYIVSKLQVDLVFSQTNFLPLRKLPCPTLLLVHQAGYFSEIFLKLQRQYTQYWYQNWYQKLNWKARRSWANVSIKRATCVTVQTQALADAIVQNIKIHNNKIVVIPHGAGLASGARYVRSFTLPDTWRIGYITKYGIQKNFEILFQTIQQLKLRGKTCKLILTLNPICDTFNTVASMFKKYNIDDCIENHGEIYAAEIRNLYNTLNIFVFPSLCESFGFTLVEAMYYGLPILAIDTQSNRELLGAGGMFFPAQQSDILLQKICNVMENKEVYVKSQNYSLITSAKYEWDTTAKSLLNIINKTIHDKGLE